MHMHSTYLVTLSRRLVLPGAWTKQVRRLLLARTFQPMGVALYCSQVSLTNLRYAFIYLNIRMHDIFYFVNSDLWGESIIVYEMNEFEESFRLNKKR